MQFHCTLRWTERRRGGCNGHKNKDWGPRQQFKFCTPIACPLNPLTPHSAMQWGEEWSGVKVMPLVSVLQTRSSQMFVFKTHMPISAKYVHKNTFDMFWNKSWGEIFFFLCF